MTAPVCCCEGCGADAVVAYRLRPKRTEYPLCQHVARATCWPGAADPVELMACERREHRTRCAEAGAVLGAQLLAALGAAATETLS